MSEGLSLQLVLQHKLLCHTSCAATVLLGALALLLAGLISGGRSVCDELDVIL